MDLNGIREVRIQHLRGGFESIINVNINSVYELPLNSSFLPAVVGLTLVPNNEDFSLTDQASHSPQHHPSSQTMMQRASAASTIAAQTFRYTILSWQHN